MDIRERGKHGEIMYIAPVFLIRWLRSTTTLLGNFGLNYSKVVELCPKVVGERHLIHPRY